MPAGSTKLRAFTLLAAHANRTNSIAHCPARHIIRPGGNEMNSASSQNASATDATLDKMVGGGVGGWEASFQLHSYPCLKCSQGLQLNGSQFQAAVISLRGIS